ncbi:MAG: hypothetical protein R6U08_09550 [Bacillota bacterium]
MSDLKSLKKELKTLKEKYEKYNMEFVKAETQFGIIKNDLKDKYNLKPSELDDRIKQLTKEIEKDEKDIDKLYDELTSNLNKIEEIING